MMVEHGEAFWKDRWDPMYGFLGGNPLAAMPSLHFATSVMAARVLREAGPAQGAFGWGYALTLGYALVHLGEHYVTDLLAGLRAGRGGAPRRAARRAAGRAGLAAACRRSRPGRTREHRRPGRRRPTPTSSDPDDEEAPQDPDRRAASALLFGLFVASAIAFLYFVLPKLTGLKDTWSRLDDGQPDVAGRWPSLFELPELPGLRRGCSARCSCAGARRVGWQGQLPDHHGRGGGDAPVRRGGRRAASR